MMFDNVLDESQTDKVQFRNCKVKYLKAENKLLTIQLDTVSQLIDQHKKILDYVVTNKGEGRTDSSCKISKLIESADALIQKCYAECQEILSRKDLFPEDDEGLITPNFFMELVVQFERSISDLKKQIIQRETLLQQLEANKNHPKRRKYEPQSKNIVKAIESYDIYPRLSEQCKEEIMNLRALQSQMKNQKSKRKKHPFSEKINEASQQTSKQDEKTIKKLPNPPKGSIMSDKNETIKEIDSMSSFQKIIMIYKKKKLFNDILENRVIALKNKIQQKEVHNQVLKAKIENDAWEMGNPGKHCLEDGDATFLSVLNQSLKANNLDFSVDISRVLMNAGKIKHEEDEKQFDNERILEGILEEEPTERRNDGENQENGLDFSQQNR